ncbi:hypothetical protein EB75_08530 [Mycobacterium sp. ST-F2]|nr:hypothetical protein EB75_08530 [Mycobacterium sp. ST-F2]
MSFALAMSDFAPDVDVPPPPLSEPLPPAHDTATTAVTAMTAINAIAPRIHFTGPFFCGAGVGLGHCCCGFH